MVNQLTLQGILEIAIEKEVESQRLYRDLAQEVTNAAARDAFIQLSREEQGHEELLKKYLAGGFKEGALDSEQLLAAQLQLAICEGSDWFWWFGDYNPSDSVSDFECLFRQHLSNLYHLLGLEPPEYLAHTFARGSGAPALGGVMRHGQARD